MHHIWLLLGRDIHSSNKTYSACIYSSVHRHRLTLCIGEIYDRTSEIICCSLIQTNCIFELKKYLPCASDLDESQTIRRSHPYSTDADYFHVATLLHHEAQGLPNHPHRRFLRSGSSDTLPKGNAEPQLNAIGTRGSGMQVYGLQTAGYAQARSLLTGRFGYVKLGFRSSVGYMVVHYS